MGTLISQRISINWKLARILRVGTIKRDCCFRSTGLQSRKSRKVESGLKSRAPMKFFANFQFVTPPVRITHQSLIAATISKVCGLLMNKKKLPLTMGWLSCSAMTPCSRNIPRRMSMASLYRYAMVLCGNVNIDSHCRTVLYKAFGCVLTKQKRHCVPYLRSSAPRRELSATFPSLPIAMRSATFRFTIRELSSGNIMARSCSRSSKKRLVRKTYGCMTANIPTHTPSYTIWLLRMSYKKRPQGIPYGRGYQNLHLD